jgi:hypothetical protein
MAVAILTTVFVEHLAALNSLARAVSAYGSKAESSAELLAKSKCIREVSWCRLAICRSAQLSTATSSTRCSQVTRDRWRFAPTVPLRAARKAG